MTAEFQGNIFYATDGSWGDALDLVILDTSDWSEEDEDAFAEFTDDERADYVDIYTERRDLRPSSYAASLEEVES